MLRATNDLAFENPPQFQIAAFVRIDMNLYDSDYNRIDVRFRHTRHDWMQLMVRTRDAGIATAKLIEHERSFGKTWRPWPTQSISCRFSSVNCPFPSLLAWLEALTTGVQRCSFSIDGEGPDADVEWRGRALAISQPEDCYGKDGNKTWYQRELSVRADRRQVISAFYMAFRSFAGSGEYQPARWERNLTAGEYAALRLNHRFSEDELVGFLAGLDAAMAEFVFQSLRLYPSIEESDYTPWDAPTGDRVRAALKGLLTDMEIKRAYFDFAREAKPVVHRYIPKIWDRFDLQQRKRHIQKMFKWQASEGHGSRLRDMRSSRIEAWLKEEVES